MKKRFFSILSIILILTLLPINAFAAPRVQTGTISGFVTEKRFSMSLPLSGVTVTLEGTEISVETSRAGRYTLKNVEAAEVNLLFSKEGYEDITKTVIVKANRLSSVNATMNKNSSPMVEIVGQVKTKYEVKDVLATIIRIYPDSVPMILDLIIPAETPLRDYFISGLLMLDAESIIDAIPSDILDSVLNNFNPQDLLNLIPDLPDEIKQLLVKIIPGSITNEMPLPGTLITVRDGSRVIKVAIADKNGSYKLKIPENCDVDYMLYGFKTKTLAASEVSDTTYLLAAAGTVRGTVTGEDNEPLEGTVVTVVSAVGKPSVITDAQGKYVIYDVERLLPGFGGGIGGHTVLFDREDYITSRATALFAFGQARADKKLELAPPIGDLEIIADTITAGSWMTSGGITMNIFDSKGGLYFSKILKLEDLDITTITKARFNLSDLPIDVYRVEFSTKKIGFPPRAGFPAYSLVVENVVIKRARTTTVDAILGGAASVNGLMAPISSGDELKFQELESIEETMTLPENDMETDSVEDSSPINPDVDGDVESEDDALTLDETGSGDTPPIVNPADPEAEAEIN